jgi:2'-5' RNA ligase
MTGGEGGVALSAVRAAAVESSVGRDDVARERTRRLFFAFWPDEPLRAMLAHATHKAVRSSGGRPVPVHNLHATVLFLGSIVESRVSAVAAIGARAAAETAAAYLSGAGSAQDTAAIPTLAFDRIELWKKAHVLVATTSVSTGAAHLLANAVVGILQRETCQAGFAPDLKPFRAHVTVARKVVRLSHELRMQEVQWPVTALALVESVTLAEGPLYSVLDSWSLGTAVRVHE